MRCMKAAVSSPILPSGTFWYIFYYKHDTLGHRLLDSILPPIRRFIVSQRTCSELAPRVPDMGGNCVCPTGTVVAGNECLSMSVLLLLLLLPAALLAVVVARARASQHESADDLRLRHVVDLVRIRLQLTRENGFYLGSEGPRSSWTQWCFSLHAGKQHHVVLNRSHLESVARLALWEDLDTNVFDAFCVCLREATGEGLQGSRINLNSIPPSPQYEALGAWILELSLDLINPKNEWSAWVARENGRKLSQFLPGRRHSILSVRWDSKTDMALAHLVITSYRSNSSQIDRNSDVDALSTDRNISKTDGVNRSSGERDRKPRYASLGADTLGNRIQAGSNRQRFDSERRFRYFLDTVCRIRLWGECDGALFKTLQRYTILTLSRSR